MNFTELIQNRQSCRNFSASEVSESDITKCLEAARLSPSACNAQPMHFTVCTGALAPQVAECTQSMGMNKFTSNVPCFIVISEDRYTASAAVGSRVKGTDYRSIDIGIATVHFTLAATDCGLSTCILGWFDGKKAQKLLGIKNDIRLIIAVGYAADEDTLRKKVRKDLSNLADFR